MFDWDDQELANILWGEGREGDDHIVPYPEDIEKNVLSEYDDNDQKTLTENNSKSEVAEKNTSTSKLLLDGSKRDKNDGLSASGAVLDSQLDLSSLTASKSDDSGIANKNQLGGVPQSSQNHHEDKELGDLVGNSWASIGSFDDLDRIFSNDDIDGNTGLGSTNELWSSPKNLLCGAAKGQDAALGSTHWEFGALGRDSANIEINSEYLRSEGPSVTTGCRKAGSISHYPRRAINRHVEQKDYAVDTAGLVEEKIGLGITVKTPIDSHTAAENIASPQKSSEKEKWSETQSEHELATDRIIDSRVLKDVYDKWPSSSTISPHFSRQYAPSTVENYSALVPDQHQLSQEFSPIPYQHLSTQYGSPYVYGNFTNHYPALRSLKHAEDEHQSIHSSSEVSRGDVINKHVGSLGTTKHTKMTPQEKIEKLRRRQQMRAMLAIQKQQQRLGHQASSGDYSGSRKSCIEDPARQMENSDLEVDDVLSIVPCYDPGSPNKGDDSSMISNIDHYSAEDTVLYQLQDIVSRMDMKIRLCIRDSLYRLAHSATQRHYVGDTSSKKRSAFEPDISKEETSNHDRFVESANMETETNHIDRVVAHLLFHRPLKLSVRHADTPESSTSTKVSTEPEAAAPSSQPTGLLPKNSEIEYILSPHGSRSLHDFVDSNEGDVSDDVSLKEMIINPQTQQITTEHAD